MSQERRNPFRSSLLVEPAWRRALLAAVALLVYALAFVPLYREGGVGVSALSIFPVVVLGIWYSKSNKSGAMAGMFFGLGMTLLAMVGWIAKVPMFGADGMLPATSSSLIVCPLAFVINIVVSNLTTQKISDASADRSDAILRKLHNLPGASEDQPPRKSCVH